MNHYLTTEELKQWVVVNATRMEGKGKHSQVVSVIHSDEDFEELVDQEAIQLTIHTKGATITASRMLNNMHLWQMTTT